MYFKINELIQSFSNNSISVERKKVLQPLIEFIQSKRNSDEPIRLNFICTHNSRRSHLAQVWAQTMAHFFNIKNVVCYSGGTEATAMFPKVSEVLRKQGFNILTLSDGNNPVYAVKYAENENPIICFSKVFDDVFNPTADFCAIMTCSSADEGCPYIAGAEKRISIRYNDPKEYDGTNLMDEKYAERSREIAQEMWYVFSQLG